MIELVSFTEQDFSRLKSWVRNEDELLQFAGKIFSFPITTEQLQDYLNDNRRIPFKVILTESKEVIGHCELNFENELPRLSRILIGDEKHRGKGYGKLITKEMLNKIFNEYGYRAADLNVFDWNHSAIKCYERMGFRINKGKETVYSHKTGEWKSLNMIIYKNERG